MTKQKKQPNIAQTLRDVIVYQKTTRNLTVSEIARRGPPGMKANKLRMFLRGDSENPVLETIAGTAHALELSMAQLFSIAGMKDVDPKKLDQLIENYALLPPEGRRHIEEAAELQLLKARQEKNKEEK